jgi:ABC-type bacteriocin/lantibiotic exporter with double-glycine peptidase domain
LLALDVPIRSQFDNSEYQASNCGPTSLAMVLEGFGVDVPTASLRGLANLLQGTYDRETGIALDHLAAIARQAGLRAVGPRDASGYRRWSIDEVRAEVRRGHPVITLVRMRELPDHAGTTSETDHYVVVVGLDGERLLINDPALPGERGFRRPLSQAELERAWAASSIPGQAAAIAAAAGVPELAFPDPGADPGAGAETRARAT